VRGKSNEPVPTTANTVVKILLVLIGDLICFWQGLYTRVRSVL